MAAALPSQLASEAQPTHRRSLTPTRQVSAYSAGLVSPTGYYKLNVEGGQYTTFTYWWQARKPLRSRVAYG